MNFANSKTGVVSMPPTTGEFKNGRGEILDRETFSGRATLVRIVWSEITHNSHKFEQAFSDDGGRTWETNMVADLTRAE